MKAQLELAIKLRQEGELIESNQLLLEMINKEPQDAYLNYQCAWSLDVLGEESRAVPFYEKAIQNGLAGEDLENALLGLGSTYRTLGEYEKSREVFQQGVTLFPNNRAIQVFFSMTLYNLNDHKTAMEFLLKCLVETTSDANIENYKRAIDFYADKLDEVWN
ncbi:hypothetical protein CSE16_20095 [Solibacillus sp. R5-41]|uniref:tetratricopeptide repeat protein n=1 Tax=Solibacillus sp. R5-41 TaxID=2048654 RepID=UPI000C1290F7|nr:tetratricopeptide repeat protein [Solibacillus sp. R5-41]ATP42125.1 hypothetical protein CSE16_20095 [Solibacillus sp. R5-41]